MAKVHLEARFEMKGQTSDLNELAAQEKHRKAQQELATYKEQMAFYSDDCCLYPTSECQMQPQFWNKFI